MITVEHLAERLVLLAAWRMPYGPRPATPPPCCEHVLPREAASALRRLDADMMIQFNRAYVIRLATVCGSSIMAYLRTGN